MTAQIRQNRKPIASSGASLPCIALVGDNTIVVPSGSGGATLAWHDQTWQAPDTFNSGGFFTVTEGATSISLPSAAICLVHVWVEWGVPTGDPGHRQVSVVGDYFSPWDYRDAAAGTTLIDVDTTHLTTVARFASSIGAALWQDSGVNQSIVAAYIQAVKLADA